MQLLLGMMRVIVFMNFCCYFVCCDTSVTDDSGGTKEHHTVLKFNRSFRLSEHPDIWPEECVDYWLCITHQLLNNITDIMKSNNFYLTSALSLNRIDDKNAENEVTSVYDEQKKLLRSPGNGYGQMSTALINSTSKLFRTHFLNWNALPGVNFKVFQSPEHDGAWDAAVEIEGRKEGSRTFGARRRIMMALLPMMYKMGVMTTMLGGLIVLALKGLTIGVILLILGLGNFIHKFKSQGAPWYPQHPTDIHVHVHTDGHKQAYSGWHYGPVTADYSEVYGQ